MSGLLNKAPWNAKSRDHHSNTNDANTQTSSFLSKTPWAKDNQGHGREGSAKPVGNFLSKAPWAFKANEPSSESHPGDEMSSSNPDESGGGGFFSKTPWSKANQDKTQETSEQSLNTILKMREDRTSLLLLIADCTETMRKAVQATFDPDETGERTDFEGKEKSSSRPAISDIESRDSDVESVIELKHGDETEAENIGDNENKAKAAIAEAEAQDATEKERAISEEKKVKAEADAKEKERKELERRVKEVENEDMKALQKASLDSFDAWRERILSRIGEAVNQSDESENAEEQSADPICRTADSTNNEHSPRPSTTPDAALIHSFPPHPTPFTVLEEPKRILILHSLLLLTLSLETYTSYSRVLLLYLSSSLHIPVHYLSTDESKVAQGLLEAAKRNLNADEQTKKAADQNVWGRRLKVGLGTVAGAALIGVTGGLAAPLLAAGIGTVMGGLGLGATATATYLGAMAGSAPLVGALFGAYGGRMAGQMVDNYAKEINDFAFLPVHKPSLLKNPTTSSASAADRRLRVTIAVTGWLTDPTDVVHPWRVIASTGSEAFALRWELDALIRLGNALTTYMKSAAWGVASKTVISQTVFATLAAGLWPLGIVKIARVVDNPFSVARSRAEKAGRVLADALVNRVQGERPVVLVGYSLGARVLYFCLDELARRGAFGLVESVVFIGAAVPADSAGWRRVRSVVAGRVVNVYSTRDSLLGFLYRTASLQYGVGGLQAIEGVAGVENVDVSEVVEGHTQYRFLTGRILEKVGFEDVDSEGVAQQGRDGRKDEEKLAEERKEAERTQKRDSEGQIEDMEKEVEMRNEKSFMGKVGDRMNAMRLGVGEKISSVGGRGRTPEGKTGDEKTSEKRDAGNVGTHASQKSPSNESDDIDGGAIAAIKTREEL